MALYPLAFYTSMHLAGVAVGTVVSIGSAPLASALIERFADGRSLSRRWLAGAALGLAGTVLLCAAEAAQAGAGTGTGSARQTVVGVLLGLVAGLTYAVYAWAAHRLITRSVTSRVAMGVVFGLGGLLLVPVLLATGAPLVASWTNAGVGIYMALVPMFTGYVLFGYGLSRIPVSTATTLSLLEPAVAAVFAVLVVGEHLPALGWTGIALVIACLGVLTAPPAASGRQKRWERRKRRSRSGIRMRRGAATGRS